jgi:hypothetical protein
LLAELGDNGPELHEVVLALVGVGSFDDGHDGWVSWVVCFMFTIAKRKLEARRERMRETRNTDDGSGDEETVEWRGRGGLDWVLSLSASLRRWGRYIRRVRRPHNKINLEPRAPPPGFPPSPIILEGRSFHILHSVHNSIGKLRSLLYPGAADSLCHSFALFRAAVLFFVIRIKALSVVALTPK